MIRKILLCFLILLCSCSRSEDKNKIEYIDPVKDLFVFGELNNQSAERIRNANADEEFRNYQFRMLEKEVYSETVTDIDGEPLDLTDHEKIYFDVVSVKCSHCRKQLHQLEELTLDPDTLFVQYFNVGDAQAIRDLYEEEGLTMRDDISIIPYSEELEDFIRYDLKIENYPTLICFKDGKVTFSVVGEFEAAKWPLIADISFEHVLSREELSDGEGNYLPDLIRGIDEVKASLSEENREKLADLGKESEKLTLKRIGKPFSFTVTKISHSDVYVNEIEDYSGYEDKELVIFYENLNDGDPVEKIALINELIEAKEGREYIVVLNEGMGSSSAILRSSGLHFECPVISMLSAIPEGFIDYEIGDYPSAVFVEKGTLTGVCTQLDTERYHKAAKIFLGEGCIARRDNN